MAGCTLGSERSARTATARPRVVAVVRPGPAVEGGPGPLAVLGGRAIVGRAVDLLVASGVVDDVLVGVDPAQVDDVAAAVGAGASVHPLPAGLLAALARCSMPGDGAGAVGLVVVVHDLGRPLAPPALVAAVVAAAAAGSAVTVPVLPLTDTVKSCDEDGRLRATPDRDGLRVVQTPQAFRVDLLAAGALDAVVSAPAGPGWAGARASATTVAGDPRADALRHATELVARTTELEDPSL